VRRPRLECCCATSIDGENLNNLGKPGNSWVGEIKEFNITDRLVFCQKVTCMSVLIVTFVCDQIIADC
jgi:hypothetical protein